MSQELEKNNLIARWLSKELSGEEEQQLKTNPEMEALKVVIDDINQWKVKPFDVDASFTKLNNVRSNKSLRKIQPFKKWLSVAASILLLFSTYLLWDNFLNAQITISTLASEQKSVVLPDGSKVELDALSKLTYNKKTWQKNRTINLSGQAYFKVEKGPTFKVLTSTTTVTVLGTQFNVKSFDKDAKVTCYEGKVSVGYQNIEEILIAGEEVIIQDDGFQRFEHNSKLPDWTVGFIKYKNESLREIIKDLERTYAIIIDLPKKHDNLKFTGTLPTNDLQTALKNLLEPLELEFKKINTKKIVVY
tara:strand:+ start:24877 stop:25788 length:912 start_codon:yes stop_codon:yes gene_type:complete